MEVAKLVLEFLQVLAWPLIAALLVIRFRRNIEDLLTKLGTKLGSAEKVTVGILGQQFELSGTVTTPSPTALTAKQVAGIEALAMDMWERYVQSTRAHLPDADRKIVFDKFHVVKHLHDAVDQVRRSEHRALKRMGDDRLTGSKYLWLMRPKDMTPDQRTAFQLLQGPGSHRDPGAVRSVGPRS